VVHQLKTLPWYFKAVKNETKTFEVRKNDRNYKVGDTLILNEYNKKHNFTGSYLKVEVTYVLKDTRFVKFGFVILGIKVIPFPDFPELQEYPMW